MKLNGAELPANPEPEKKKFDRLVEESPVEYKTEVKQEIVAKKIVEKPIEKPKVVEEIPPPEMQESLQDKWSKFIAYESLIGSEISMVKEVVDIEFGSDNIKLYIKDQFIYDNLHSHIRQLQSSFTDISNSKAHIELIKVKKEEEVIEEREKHPIEQKIITDFKAFEEKSLD
jgi:hypothetical protein